MSSGGSKGAPPGPNIYKISRLGKKLNISNDFKLMGALPRDVPERIWAETLQKEDNDLIVFEMREEIFEEAMKMCYADYMDRQTVAFVSHCTAEAYIKLLDVTFYRHDPGEEPTAHPPCYIPKRLESWEPDKLPDTSPKDNIVRHNVAEVEEASMPEEELTRWPSSSSLNIPVVPPIPDECKFPGKVRLDGYVEEVVSVPSQEPVSDDSYTPLEQIGADSEMLQKITDYGSTSSKGSYGMMQTGMTIESSLHGAGDSYMHAKRQTIFKTKPEKRPVGKTVSGRTRTYLPPLKSDSRSVLSFISDCRIRNLRLDTQFEVTSEKLDSPNMEFVKKRGKE